MKFFERIKLFFKPIESYEYFLSTTTKCKYQNKENHCTFTLKKCRKNYYTRCHLYIDKDLKEKEKHGKKITTMPINFMENSSIRKQNDAILKYLRSLK